MPACPFIESRALHNVISALSFCSAVKEPCTLCEIAEQPRKKSTVISETLGE